MQRRNVFGWLLSLEQLAVRRLARPIGQKKGPFCLAVCAASSKSPNSGTLSSNQTPVRQRKAVWYRRFCTDWSLPWGVAATLTTCGESRTYLHRLHHRHTLYVLPLGLTTTDCPNCYIATRVVVVQELLAALPTPGANPLIKNSHHHMSKTPLSGWHTLVDA